jgi:hypothetical protein
MRARRLARMFPPAFVRSMLVSGTPEASGGGTFSQPPPPFVSHATARTPRAHRRGPAHAAASSSFVRPSPRPTLDRTPGAARASPARHEASRGVRDSAGVREALQVRGEEPEEHRRQSGPTALLPVAQEGTSRARPTPSTRSRRASRAKRPNEAAWKKTRTQSLNRKLGSERFSFARDAAVSPPPAPSSPPRHLDARPEPARLRQQ